MELLLGCGAKRSKHVTHNGNVRWNNLVTLDMNPDHKPDVVWDLTILPLPFEDNTFDEIHIYETLEHLGQQGDWRRWFQEFTEYWRILKPDGLFIGSSPRWDGPWAWGDPGHSRIVSPEAMTYLDQTEYTKQVGITAMTDYRFVYQADFRPIKADFAEFVWSYVLQAVKPSRIQNGTG